MVNAPRIFHSGRMSETSDHPLSLPDRLSGFVDSTSGVDAMVLFTRDSLVYAYSRGMTQESAEQWSSILGSMLSMSDRCGKTVNLGDCEHILHKDPAGPIIIHAVTPGCGAAMFLSPDAVIKDCAYHFERFRERLAPSLPQKVSTTVGAARHLQGVA